MYDHAVKEHGKIIRAIGLEQTENSNVEHLNSIGLQTGRHYRSQRTPSNKGLLLHLSQVPQIHIVEANEFRSRAEPQYHGRNLSGGLS